MSKENFNEIPEEERTADTVLAFTREAAEVNFVDEAHLNELSFCKYFTRLKEKNKNHVAVKYYDAFMLGTIDAIRDVVLSAGNIFADYIGVGIVNGKGMNGFEILDWLRQSDDAMRYEAFGQDEILWILEEFTNKEIAEGITLYEEAQREKEELKKKRDAFLSRCADAHLKRKAEGK